MAGSPVPESLPPDHNPTVPADSPALSTGKTDTFGGAAFQSTVPPEQGQLLPGVAGTPALSQYALLEELGRGGMGVVYKARHLGLDRVVALKMILHGEYAGVEERLRFQREAQAMARLRHEHVVQVYDIGEEAGKPFFALEYIEGGTLAQRLKRERLSARASAELLEKLARGVQAAHEAGIIHRDLKPGNVLLTSDGVPKVTDFGLARDVQGPDRTRSGAVMGTPSYMAPEQAAGKVGELGTAIDVYALGAILYECLTGRPPFQAATTMETLDLVRTQEPIGVRVLQPRVARDLETICLKCLQKESAKRYASAVELADDLGRFLRGEPIRARPVGALGRAWRWCKRNPVVAALGTAVMLALAAGSATSTLLWMEARDQAAEAELQRGEAETAAEHARERQLFAEGQELRANEEAKNAKEQARRAEISASFMRELFISSDPTGLSGVGLMPAGEQGRNLTAAQLLDRGAAQIGQRLKDEPLTRAALLDTIGEVSRTLGLFEKSLPLLEEALQLRRQHLPANHPEVAASLLHLGNWYSERGEIQKGEQAYREAITLHEKRGAGESLENAEVQLRLAVHLVIVRDPAAEELARAGLATRLKHLGEQHRDVAVARFALSAALLSGDKNTEARLKGLEALRFLLEGQGKQDPVFASVGQFQQGMMMTAIKLHGQAEKAYRKSLELMQQAMGREHIYNLIVMAELGGCLREQKRLKEAEEVWKDALTVVRKTVGLEHPRVMVLVEMLADLLAEQKRVSEARQLYQETLTAQERRYGKTVPWRFHTLMNYSALEGKHGDLSVAERTSREVLGLLKQRKTLTRDEFIMFSNMAQELGKRSNLLLVREVYTLLLDRERKQLGPTDELLAFDLNEYGKSLVKNKRYTEADPYLREGLRIAQGNDKVEPQVMGQLRVALATVELSAGRRGEVERLLRESLEPLRKSGFVNSLKEARGMLATLLVQQNRIADLLTDLEHYRKLKNLASWDICWSWHVEAMSRLLTNDRTGYEVALRRQEEWAERDQDEDVLAYCGRTAALAPSDRTAGATERIAARLEAALKKKNPSVGRGSLIHARLSLALCLFRTGKFAESLRELDQLPSLTPSLETTVQLVRTLANHRKERTPTTRKELESVLRTVEHFMQIRRQHDDPAYNHYYASWLLDLELLRRQGQAELASPP